MERDRWSYLAIQAHKQGLLDFHRSHRLDERWRLKEELILGEVERDISAKLHEIIHLAEACAAQYVSASVFEHHYKRAAAEYDVIRGLLRPYVTAASVRKDAAKYREIWEDAFGSLDDPEVQASINRTVELLRQKSVEPVKREYRTYDLHGKPKRNDQPRTPTVW